MVVSSRMGVVFVSLVSLWSVASGRRFFSNEKGDDVTIAWILAFVRNIFFEGSKLNSRTYFL